MIISVSLENNFWDFKFLSSNKSSSKTELVCTNWTCTMLYSFHMELCFIILNIIWDFSLLKMWRNVLYGQLDSRVECSIRYLELGNKAHLCGHPADPVCTGVLSTGLDTLVHSQWWQSQRTFHLGWAQPVDHRSGLLIICGSQGRRTAQPSAPQRQTGSCLWLMKWLNTGKLFYLNRFAFLLDLWPWQLHCSHSGFVGQRRGFHFSHFTLLDKPDSCWLINFCNFFFIAIIYCCHFHFFGGEYLTCKDVKIQTFPNCLPD